MIDDEQAREQAQAALHQAPLLGDPLLAPWRAASLGQPVLVLDVWRRPSYWLVPVLLEGRAAGFVRVLEDGRVGAVGALYRDPTRLADSPAVVTGIDAPTAARRAVAHVWPEQGETAADPVFVHDGPPGREAWLIEVSRGGQAVRWVFVTPAFVYDRPAGQPRDEARE